MSRTGLAMVLAFALMSAAAQDSPEQKAKEEIFALDAAWVKAEVGHYREALEPILDENFVFTLASGRTGGRKEFLEMILRGPATRDR